MEYYGFLDTLKFNNELSEIDKEYLIIKAWHTGNKILYNKVFEIINNDTNLFTKLKGIQSLSKFRTPQTINFLLPFLTNNNDIGMISALSLIQLGEYNKSLEYIKKHYNSECNYKSQIVTAMMIINNNQSLEILKVISEDVEPSYAIDALVAISLLGDCEFAYRGFLNFTQNESEYARIKAVWCLAYYTATSKAFKVISLMINDKNESVQAEVYKIMKHYKL